MQKIKLIVACFITMITVSSCDDKEILLPPGGIPPKIGDSYQGGTVFYVDGTGHGLIADSDDIGGYTWGGSGYSTYTNGTSYGTGKENTHQIAIASGVYDGAAYYLYYSYSSGGYSDWYLPSKDELTFLYNQKSLIPTISQNSYWSSSEINSTSAYRISFSTGTAYTGSKSNTYNVRAIRSF